MKRQRSSSSGKDRISELPDEILASIVSLLTMKEAGRTSVVSRRWIEIWKFYNGDLDFDGSSTLARYAREGNMGGAGIAWYRSWVDQVLNSHKGLEIEKFKDRYGLEKRHKDDIDRWITFAMGKNIKELDLNLYSFSGGYYEHAYSFPSSLLSPLAVSNLNNLTRLCLASVDITEEGIAYFLANCSSLQKLIVRCAMSLVNLKINSHSLRFLEVSQCRALNSIEISARELHSFKYWGRQVSIGYNDVPSLKHVSLGNFYMQYVLETLSQHPLLLSQVKILTLDLTFMLRSREGCFFTRTFPQLCNVRQLELEVLVYHDQCILYLYSLIVASVQLEKLVVKFKIAEWARCEKVILNPCNPRLFEELVPSIEAEEEEEEEIGEVARERARQLGRRLPPGVELVIM
ncbi:hypothetical protein ACH5RR_030615 [Cinchona calisaya]|uniref:F-box domain-containing protein n=1 Tax=Cinchona calisaya TaxID=153742 RepID=A0ABD2YV57_9GENT